MDSALGVRLDGSAVKLFSFAGLRPRSVDVFSCELAFLAGLCTIGRRGRLRSARTPTLRSELTQKNFKNFPKKVLAPH